ncbi:GNAT family N-acetyltransferase [Kutzneria albida]|uniref:N-acetyltransferase domain-containing protein n=1 Tax=Kutzneria albida DSM 43870 TaxID=1449976 RepID=W5WJ63_9PSEU|nr:GNAT family N-acetyltransferase [Kutzneria albida]AHI00918.1 hypothetical protein KALB_7560 [Kutzneria albida DSM 43870]
MTETRTERLRLSRPVPEDLAAVAELHGDPETNLHNPSGARTPEESAQLLDSWLDDWATHGIGYWTARELVSGEVVGFGGLRPHELDGALALNLYYRFRPAVWGRGYATELARASAAWARRVRPELPVVIVTRQDNHQSVRVAEKIGFVLSGTTRAYGGESLVYRAASTTVPS